MDVVIVVVVLFVDVLAAEHYDVYPYVVIRVAVG